MVVDTTTRTLQYCSPGTQKEKFEIKLHTTQEWRGAVKVMTKEHIPAKTRCQIRVKLVESTDLQDCIGYFEPDYNFTCANGVIFANCLCSVDCGTIIVEAINMFDCDMDIDKNTKIGGFVPRDNEVYRIDQEANSSEFDASDLFDFSQTELTEEQICKVKEIFNNNHLAVSKNDCDLGLTSTISHTINVQGAEPHKLCYRRLQGTLRDEVESELHKLERDGIIEHSHSAWCSPIVPVRKKDNSLRLCIDYRLLNSKTKLDSFPLPNMEDILSSLSDSMYFSTLDMARGYYQIPVDEASKELTAFSSGSALYQFKVLPFGVANGVATYQRLMSLVLAGVSWDVCIAYIDDLIVLGRSFDEHLSNLDSILKRLVAHNLKIKPRKCSLFKSQVNYLGHTVSNKGILPNAGNVQTILEYPPPRTVKELKRFLGMINFFRRFIKNASDIMSPLFEVTKSNKLSWTEKCAESFETLKKLLSTSPILAYPDFKNTANDFIITADASSRAAGATLSQIQNGNECIIAYASSTFSAAERGYSATERELAAIRFAVKHFKAFVQGRRFIIRTDHNQLIY